MNEHDTDFLDDLQCEDRKLTKQEQGEYWYMNIKDREFIEREQAMDTVRVKTVDEALPF